MRTAVIGVGRMGRCHLRVIQEIGLDLVAVCDRSEEALVGAVEDFGVSAEGRFSSADQMFDQVKPECVVIATTAEAHCDYTCLAAEHGCRYILCEKPMAVSLAECDRMITACERGSVALAVNHQMRFMQHYTELKRVMASPRFGGVRSVNIVAGNFGLAMNGTHYFEMFRYITDEAPGEVTAWFSDEVVPNPRGREFEDQAGAVRVITERGRRLHLEVGADQGHGVTEVFAGRYGQLVVDELAGTMRLITRRAEHRSLPTTRYGTPTVEETWRVGPADSVGSSRRVLEALLSNSGYPSGQDGRQAVATLVAAYVSSETGHRPVVVSDRHLPLERIFPWA